MNTSNTSAEYSRPGMVEIVTKSGTNQFHGQLFELYQTSDLAAKSSTEVRKFSCPQRIRRQLFRSCVVAEDLRTGRIRTFFFFDAEGIRQSSAAQERYTVPEANWKQGDFSNYVDSSGQPVKIYDPLTTTFDPATGSYVSFSLSPAMSSRLNRINPSAAKVAAAIPNPNVNIPYYLGQDHQNPNAAAKRSEYVDYC